MRQLCLPAVACLASLRSTTCIGPGCLTLPCRPSLRPRSRDMKDAGVAPNSVTQQLLEGVCKEGVRAVEKQQAAAAALSAAVVAAGTLMMKAGIF